MLADRMLGNKLLKEAFEENDELRSDKRPIVEQITSGDIRPLEFT